MRPDQQDASGAAAGEKVDDELVVMLDLLAATIVQALGFGVACFNIVRPDGTLHVVSVAGDDEARQALLGTVGSARAWEELLLASEPWGRLRFEDHRNVQAANVDVVSWVPNTVSIDAEDAWHPEDALYAPLLASDGSRLLGALSVDLPRDGRRPGSGTCQVLEALAISAALVIEHAALRGRAETSERRYRYLASHDALTGVGNRSVLSERLEHVVTRRPDDGSAVSVVFVDLDKFKDINDQHSHAAGDHVLKVVATRIEALVRPHDTVVRWGGDEFLVLLEGESESAALAVAQRITAAVAEPITGFGDDLSITASVGVAVRHAATRIGVDDLITRADEAMYEAKRRGGNAYACTPPTPQQDRARVYTTRDTV